MWATFSLTSPFLMARNLYWLLSVLFYLLSMRLVEAEASTLVTWNTCVSRTHSIFAGTYIATYSTEVKSFMPADTKTLEVTRKKTYNQDVFSWYYFILKCIFFFNYFHVSHKLPFTDGILFTSNILLLFVESTYFEGEPWIIANCTWCSYGMGL